MQELGAEVFYKMAEADEVDGIESTVDPWIENIWPTLKEAAATSQVLPPLNLGMLGWGHWRGEACGRALRLGLPTLDRTEEICCSGASRRADKAAFPSQ